MSSIRAKRKTSLFQTLRTGEISGRWPTSLRSLPPSFCARIDSENVRESLQRKGLGELLLEIEQRLVRRQHLLQPDVTELAKLVTRIGTRVCESTQQRNIFITCQGDVVLMQLLLQLVPPHASSIESLAPIINETIQILAELAISDTHQAEALSTQHALLALLFRLMGDKHTVDAALTLAQELLAVGPDIFPLSAVPQLPQLLFSLSPRGLSLVGRALAVLLAKAAEQTMDGVPAPECVAPDLCASCANNHMLLAIPSLLPRIIALLRLRAPPPGLWGHMLAQLPNAQALMQQWQDEREHDWAHLGESRAPSPHVVVLLAPEQVPPALRELVTANPGMGLPAAGAGNTPLPGFFPAEAHESLHLSSLQNALWCTLQADLLYVLWALMGGKTKADAQHRLVGLGLLDVLQTMFDRLDWRPPPTNHHVQHGAGCTCSPQSCLQMQLLRTLQVLCEKESDQLSYHRLLLQPRSTPAPSPAAAAGPSAAPPVSLIPTPSAEDSALPNTDEQALDRPVSSSSSSSAPPSVPSNSEGLLFAIMRLLLQQPSDSVYLLGLASCVHKWVQASSAAEQKLVADFPGFIEFVLKQLLCEPTPPEPQLQVFFDLLAELLKFNPPLLLQVQRELVRGPDGADRARALTDRLASHIVDASIFVQCVALTLNSSTSPRRGCKALADLGLPIEPPAEAATAGAPATASPADATMTDTSTAAATLKRAEGDSTGDAGASAEGAGAGAAGSAARATSEATSRAGSSGSKGSGSAAEGSGSMDEADAEATRNECVVVTSTPLSAAFAGIGAGGSNSCQKADCACSGDQCSECEVVLPAAPEPVTIDPALQTLLTTPLALPAPAPPGVIEDAATGEIARYIVEHEVELTLRLMGTVQVSEVSVETMCVINAAIVFFLIAERRGERPALTNKVLKAAAANEPTLRPISSFLKLLGFWGDVYHSHSCERRFLEFSSGVPFEQWLSLVGNLKRDLQRALDALPA